MVEEWNDWIIDKEQGHLIEELRLLLADHDRSHDKKFEALTLLTNIADEESLHLLRWYYKNPDPGMELTAMLALIEAERLHRETELEPWHEELLDKIDEIADRLTISDYLPEPEIFHDALAQALRLEGMHVEEGGVALLKYDGELIDIAPLDLVINNQVLIAFWDRHDEEAALKNWTKGSLDEELPEPLHLFYSSLRAANLPWGIQIDISRDTLVTNFIQNMDVDHGCPRVEYILAMPKVAIARN